jgi:hypothetical protein
MGTPPVLGSPVLCPCSCGEAKPHPIATRRTADNYGLTAWSDGDLTTWDGRVIGKKLAAIPMYRVLSRVELFDFSEVKGLVMAARSGL